MTESIAYVPVTGTWVRQGPARGDAVPARPRPTDGRFHRAGEIAVYLADSEPTAWAEWYRWLAEWAEPPLAHIPRALRRRSWSSWTDYPNGRSATAPPPEFPISAQVDGELRELRVRCGRVRYRVLYQRSDNLLVLDDLPK